ncbi:protein NRT1/ PTR FAMILY 1.1-like [Tripterygium wilfordii]|uniref:protein NRT1/ PTR FAMILY 1.1-like n=1 Tax=Tripterygium wilfordii TaxID=458696 RepID=UPI0018F7E595|nr:protein NRT1/ PTR FAMILY 1.1-like [Tripterygium wilfordii]
MSSAVTTEAERMKFFSEEKGTTTHDDKVARKKGGLRTMPFIIANETIEKVAGAGLHANMILYLIYQYHMSNATGAYVLSIWGAVTNFLPILGAFLADSWLGRFRVIAIGTIISLTGIIMLWLTAIIPSARPSYCNLAIQTTESCPSPNSAQLAFLFSSFALMAIGAGGIRPCSIAFGADQLNNPDNPKNDRILQTFFNWYYASVGISIIFAVLVIVYIQERAGWAVGFGIPVGLMFLSAVFYFLGSPLYVKVKADKSLLTSFAQVVAAAWKKKHLELPPTDSDKWFYHKGSKIFAPTEKLRFLNKACIIENSDKNLNSNGLAAEPWNLCTVRQVEELKALIKVIPIWSTGIMIAAVISQHSFPVLQAKTMDRTFIGNFKIPAASIYVFAILTLTIWVAIYDRLLVPLLSKFTNEPRGLSFKQRMGMGLAIACLATAVAAEVERRRREVAFREGLADKPQGVVSMSVMWLAPQYCLTGLAEALNAIGQLEFFYSQFPKSMGSIAVALLSLGFAVGSLVASLIIGIVDDVSKKGGDVSWVSDNLNRGHYDYYYLLLSILSVVNVLYYILCSWAYGCEKSQIWDEEGKELEEEELKDHKGSPIIQTTAIL